MSEDDKRVRRRVFYAYNVMCFKKIDFYTQKETVFAARIAVFDISYGGIGIVTNKRVEIGDIFILISLLLLQIAWNSKEGSSGKRQKTVY